MNQVPEKLINFRVYEDGADYLGVADVELPAIEAMTETVKGAGIAGEVESPVLGHFGSMSLKINWRVVTRPTVHLAQQRTHSLDLRGAIQVQNAGTGEYRVAPMKVAVRCIPKKTELGKLDVGATSDAANEFEVTYINVSLDGKKILEIDKYNYICVIDGVDYLKKVREALGLS
ncbi:MAG TPA: phage major tail tube protein [Bacillota bacterium]|nr:phage major tail tube protein [Bacillota bacterium]